MSSGWEEITLGPFDGGINSYSDVSSIGNNELVDCINFEVDIDGRLKARPPIQNVQDFAWSERIVMVGTYINASGTYLIGSNSQGVYHSLNGTGAWTLITNTVATAITVQYNDLLWIIPVPGSGNPGGTWNGTSFTADADIPQGEAAKIYKERLFIAPGNAATTNPSRIRFSDAGDFGTWPASNFIDISKGDGTKLIDLAIYKGNLLLFKNDSTFVFAYDTAPADGIMENVSPVVGATAYNCIVEYENSVFTYHEGRVYELINYDFQATNVKVPFFLDQAAPSTRAEEVFLSLLGDRLVFRYYNRVYVYGLRTRTWGRWESAQINLHNFGPLQLIPSTLLSDANDVYYGGSSILADANVYKILDQHDGVTLEQFDSVAVDIRCTALTKNYDFDRASRYKRFFGWGIDCLTNRDVTGTITPVSITFSTTWGDLITGLKTWSDVGTWATPLGSIPSFTKTIVGGGVALRRLLRLPKALRYRQINFRVEMLTNGTTSDGPCQLFHIIAMVKVKQLVEKATN